MPKQINKIVLPALLILVVVFFLKRQNAPDSEALANALKDTITLIDVRSEGEFQSGSLEGATISNLFFLYRASRKHGWRNLLLL